MADQNVGIVITATDRTAAAFKSVDGGLSKLSLGITKAYGAIGLLAGAGAGGFLALSKQAIEFGDNIAKVSDKIGLTTDALQELRFAAERSGVSQDTLDMAMQRFSRRVGEAANGTGELVKTLDQYGIKVRDSEGNMRSLEAILTDYANTIQGAESDQERLRLAFKAFDSEGAALVNTLKGGASGLNELRQAAIDTGAIMDDVLIRRAEQINDRWDELTNTIGVKFKSALIAAADSLLNFFKIYNDLDSTLDALADAEFRLVEAEDRILTSRGRNKRAAELARNQAIKDIDTLEEQAKVYREIEERINSMRAGGAVELPSVKVGKIDKSITPKDTVQDDAHVKAFEDYQKYLTDWAEATRVSLLSETDLENENFQKQIDNLKNAKDLEIETKTSYWELEQGLLTDHVNKLNQIQQKGQSRDQQVWESGWQGKLQITSGILGDISQLMNTESRKQFEIGKAAATAQAIVDTIASAQGVFKAYSFNPPLAYAAAAAALIAGFARVQAIQSTQFGASSAAGSASSGSGVSGSAAAPPAPTEPPISADTEKSTLTVQFLGDVYGLEDFQDTVIKTIRDAITDKDEIIIRANSRQAVELR